MNDKWLNRFNAMAADAATWSKDRSTKHGAVIVNPMTRAVVAIGYNGFTDGIDDTDDTLHERPTKYIYTEHSERNAIYHCSREGIATKGMVLFVTGYPCPDCARAIVRSGIICVYIDSKSIGGDYDTRWKELTTHSAIILRAAGVNVQYV